MFNRFVRRSLMKLGVVAALLIAVPYPRVCHAQHPNESRLRMRNFLESRLAANPDDASSWRLLGRFHLQEGDLRSAYDALQRAVELAPVSPAAHFDFATVLMDIGRREAAAEHFQEVVNLAPNSHYAQQSRTHLSRLPAPPNEATVQPAGYDIRRFDGSDTLDLVEEHEELFFDKPNPLSVRLELGGLYNSNVTLTPTSRDFFNFEAAAFQGFLDADIELRILNGDVWRAGPTFLGYFSLNESDFGDLDLQSYRPGMFVERTVYLDNKILIPRFAYDYTLDEFDGVTFGERHALTTSLSSLWDGGDISVLYWTLDYSVFADDGTNPPVTSRDSKGHTIGASHTFYTGIPLLTSISSGVDVQLVDAEGADFTYNGVATYLATEFCLTERSTLFLEGGWGYRDYHDFTQTPSRNESIWRASVRLQRAITEHWSWSAIFTYDRFDSDNVLFEARRYLAGVVTTIEF